MSTPGHQIPQAEVHQAWAQREHPPRGFRALDRSSLQAACRNPPGSWSPCREPQRAQSERESRSPEAAPPRPAANPRSRRRPRPPGLLGELAGCRLRAGSGAPPGPKG
ncbi:E3 Ubiquitin-Protein Ligase Rad18 [Manis pentadactyla]|nr:E3 Ubiquitin-Protein Ligase Rad18 [Manis pentadactyla]